MVTKFHQYTEYQQLQEVILGTPFKFSEGEKINDAMRQYYGSTNAPDKTKLITEYQILKNILINNNVVVYEPLASDTIQQQLAPRDIAFVIGDKLVVSNMKWKSRINEINAIQHILDKFNGKIIKVPEKVNIEGGNILIDKDTIFVGVGLRTNYQAIKFLEEVFANQFQVVPIYLNDKEEIIHLDAVFNIIANQLALIHKDGFKKIPKEITKYELIELTKKEKNAGGANALPINDNIIIIRNNLHRIHKILKQKKYQVYEAEWDEIKKTGTVGPRCATLPLIRI